MADPENAKRFYNTATPYIELVKERIGIDPRISVTCKRLEVTTPNRHGTFQETTKAA